MKPIAKAMAVAVSASALIATTSGAAGARKARTLPPASNGQRQTIAAETDGFVIRAAIPDVLGGTALPPAQPRFIPIGSDIHLDARILASGQTK